MEIETEEETRGESDTGHKREKRQHFAESSDKNKKETKEIKKC